MQIDKKKIYKVDDYSFENLISQPREQLLQILEWRNTPQIRKYMYNKDVISLENHLKFVESLSSREDVAYWLVKRNGEPAGVINLIDLDFNSERAELGYYMKPSNLNSGLGIDFVYHILLFVFIIIGVTHLYGAMDIKNDKAIIVDTYMGFLLGNIKTCGCNCDSKYVEWTLERDFFLASADTKNNIRNFVMYSRNFKNPFTK